MEKIPEKINYPPREIIDPSGAEKKDFEYIILWMLNNNEECNWSVFLEKPLEISLATLSKYMNLLKREGYVEKVSKGLYKITLKGKKKYFDLRHKDSLSKDLKYPPDLIYKKRNYTHIILWMLYNNESCKWTDFLEKPLSINNHSLSKNLNSLIKQDFVKINESNYQITELGEKEYSKILRIYNLDYQSILEEELKKLGRVRKNLADFFIKWNVGDEDVKIIFLDLINQFDYLKIKNSISSETDFHKIILFLSLNNITRYPEYITKEEFAKTYNLNIATLEFFLQKLLEERIFSIRFLEFNAGLHQKYYIRTGERFEQMMGLIIDENIKKYSVLNLMELNTSSEERKNYSINIFKNIINDISANLFNKELKLQLIKFLYNYITVLYDDLKREIPSNLNDKLKVIILQDIINSDDKDLKHIRRELFQLTPILREFPKYKIFDEIKKKMQY